MPKSKLKPRSDGRYQKSIVDPQTGNRIYFYGSSEREINQKILQYTKTIERGKNFSEVAEEWWEKAYDIISPTSVRGYRVAKERAVQEFGNLSIKEITAHDISAYLCRLGNLGYAKSTVKNYKIVVNRIFNHALVAGYINYMPTQGVEIPRGLKETRRTAATPEDEKIIQKTADVWIMPYMALMTGLRKGELLALRWQDIDFQENTIHVTRSLYYEGGANTKSTKTESGKRIVPLLKPLREQLLKIKTPQNKPTDFIISDVGYKPLSQKRFRTLEKRYREATGVKSTMHQLRKSFATISVKAGINPKTLQSIMGHKNITTTYNIYADVRKDSIDEAGTILSELFSQN